MTVVETSKVFNVNTHKTFILSADYTVKREEIRAEAIPDYPKTNRVRRRGKVMCWRTAENIEIYRNRRMFERAVDELLRAEEEAWKKLVLEGLSQTGVLP